jgi:hypothetical protein
VRPSKYARYLRRGICLHDYCLQSKGWPNDVDQTFGTGCCTGVHPKQKIPATAPQHRDYFVALLLAMTTAYAVIASAATQSRSASSIVDRRMG